MEYIFLRYLHFIGIFILVSALVGEVILTSKRMDLAAFKKLIIVDSIYGLGAITTLIGGLSLWFMVGKPAEFYSHNYVFHIKLTVFVIVGLLSVFPTYFLFRNRKANSEFVDVPSYIVNILRAELALLVLVPLLAVLIALGIGNS